MQATLNLIGSGHVARSLGRLWHRHDGIEVRDVLSRTASNAGAACDFIGGGRPVVHYADLAPADLILIATPDDQIADCCERLVAGGSIRPGTVVFHCSGSLPSSVLAPASACGAHTASIHPVRSFASPEQVVASFAGTWCGVEGNEAALAVLRPLFTGIGARLVDIDPAAKTVYHAAAVFACNYLVTLLDVAVQAYGHAGIAQDVAMQMMAPLVRKTVEQAFAVGTADALSGPIARGDMATVARQQAAVASWDADKGALYALLAKETMALAQRKGSVNR
ncbi:MAG: DUF2520 domain-containing protein [Oxalobacteraceae bacterium]|nr:MAG: DUF2520 domain-containing protein [Oxalobacteraceae bacterium]